MMAVEYLSYPMEGREKYFRDVRKYVGKRRALTFGFGAAVVAASMIPLFNFFVMPAAVAGATILYTETHLEEYHRKSGSSKPGNTIYQI